MAVGDAVSDHVAASTDAQPASGVEWKVSEVSGANTNLPQYKDGVATVNIVESSTAVVSGKRIHALLTNANYIGTIASNTIFFSGLQTNA